MGRTLFDEDDKEDEHTGNKEEDEVGKEEDFGEEKDSDDFHDATQGYIVPFFRCGSFAIFIRL